MHLLAFVCTGPNVGGDEMYADLLKLLVGVWFVGSAAAVVLGWSKQISKVAACAIFFGLAAALLAFGPALLINAVC